MRNFLAWLSGWLMGTDQVLEASNSPVPDKPIYFRKFLRFTIHCNL
jgi:hypothetical protein